MADINLTQAEADALIAMGEVLVVPPNVEAGFLKNCGELLAEVAVREVDRTQAACSYTMAC